jgi:hypothetical protein
MFIKYYLNILDIAKIQEYNVLKSIISVNFISKSMIRTSKFHQLQEMKIHWLKDFLNVEN